MSFQTFGKFIFPAVTTIFSLDVLSSVYHDMSSYDISYSETGDLLEESFPHNIKNSCNSEIKKISVTDILHSHEYIDYFVEGKTDLDRSDYFKKDYCSQDDSFNRKEVAFSFRASGTLSSSAKKIIVWIFVGHSGNP